MFGVTCCKETKWMSRELYCHWLYLTTVVIYIPVRWKKPTQGSWRDLFGQLSGTLIAKTLGLGEKKTLAGKVSVLLHCQGSQYFLIHVMMIKDSAIWREKTLPQLTHRFCSLRWIWEFRIFHKNTRKEKNWTSNLVIAVKSSIDQQYNIWCHNKKVSMKNTLLSSFWSVESPPPPPTPLSHPCCSWWSNLRPFGHLLSKDLKDCNSFL